MLKFANPEFLALLAVIPVLVIWYIRQHRARAGTIRYSNIGTIKSVGRSRSTPLRHSVFVSRALVVALLIVAFARPQSGRTEQEVITEGIDIVLAMDISTSMRAEDFKPKNRLAVAKEVVEDFVESRVSDRIGMVVFAAESFTQCPLTLDYDVLLGLLDSVEIGMIDERSTALGMAIATAANRLRESDAESKVVVLLTDGRNNAGEIDPITAAGAAQALGIKIHTIAAGTPEGGPIPIDDPFMVWAASRHSCFVPASFRRCK